MTIHSVRTVELPVPAGPRGRLRGAYLRWREDRDFAAIVRALARLGDRRLALIGMRRDDLGHYVERMMGDAETDRRLSAEVLEILHQQERRGTGRVAAKPPLHASVEVIELRRAS